jgi:hypothetical protein
MGKFKYSHADVAEAQKQHRKGYEGQPLDVVHSINLFMIRWPIKCKPSPAKKPRYRSDEEVDDAHGQLVRICPPQGAEHSKHNAASRNAIVSIREELDALIVDKIWHHASCDNASIVATDDLS